ncbi:restriction endonuclease subunit S [Puniceicoccales bacterium CK1056]|uniref:Restriction endonuclease subunit S n=1 Tax=Oceanipulchritudo coccoides TaxID=2706888 RepID=A0A6B2LY84_9BACT|nr:restriction endonuclease subunit S [Oceanipulchritudo coccoides]NDV61082.1 restriction endonuclease subunit S [Oceanipulchritudo coccoides]
MDYKISEIATISAGYQSRKAIKNDPDGSHCLLQIRDFNPERTHIDPSDMIRLTPTSSNRDESLRSGDVVFLSRGQKNFAFAVPEFPEPTLAGSYFFVLRPKQEVTGTYLAWYLNQPAAQYHFKRLSTVGAHMPIVTRDVVESLKLPIPSMEIQQKIIKLSALADEQAQLLAQLAKKKHSLANAACMHATHL